MARGPSRQNKFENIEYLLDAYNIEETGDLPAEIVSLLHLIEKKPMTQEQILEKGVKSRDLAAALRDKIVKKWDVCLDDSLYYVEDCDSEEVTDDRVKEWMEVHQLDDIVFDIMNNGSTFNSKFDDMLEFLQSFNDSRIKEWNPISFYTVLSYLFDSGRLKYTNLAPLLDVIEESKSSPIDELDLELANAKKLVKLNLLSCIDEKAGLYSYGYCAFLADYLNKHGIDYSKIMNKDFAGFTSEQVAFLNKIDLFDGEKLTKHGEISINYLCKCKINKDDRENELIRIADNWKTTASSENKLDKAVRYLLKAARLEKKINRPCFNETLASAAVKFCGTIEDKLFVNKAEIKDITRFVELYGFISGAASGTGKKCEERAYLRSKEFVENHAQLFSANGAETLSGAMYYVLAKESDTRTPVVPYMKKGIEPVLDAYEKAAMHFKNAGKHRLAFRAIADSKLINEDSHKILCETFENRNKYSRDEAGVIEDVFNRTISVGYVTNKVSELRKLEGEYVQRIERELARFQADVIQIRRDAFARRKKKKKSASKFPESNIPEYMNIKITNLNEYKAVRSLYEVKAKGRENNLKAVRSDLEYWESTQHTIFGSGYNYMIVEKDLANKYGVPSSPANREYYK